MGRCRRSVGSVRSRGFAVAYVGLRYFFFGIFSLEGR